MAMESNTFTSSKAECLDLQVLGVENTVMQFLSRMDQLQNEIDVMKENIIQKEEEMARIDESVEKAFNVMGKMKALKEKCETTVKS